METLPIIFAVAFVASFAGIALLIAYFYSKSCDEVWNAAAEKLGLVHDSGGLLRKRSIAGRLHRQRVRVETVSRSHGSGSSTQTRYRIAFPSPLGMELRLESEGLFSGIAAVFGAQDIEVGDPEFDQSVVVKGRNPDAVASFLTPGRRHRVLRLFHAMPGCVIDDYGISWASSGVERDSGKLVEAVRRLVGVANQLTGQPTQPPALDRALEAKREGRLDEALGIVRHEPRGRVRPGAAPREKAAPAEPPAEPPPADEPALDSREVCEELFRSGVLGLEASRTFEERYEGRTVRWTGTLRRARRYRFDLVFGNEPGTQAVVELHEVQGGAFARTVQAVVQLPEQDSDHLASRVGQRVAFEGRLVRCDTLMRNLYVADGRVV